MSSEFKVEDNTKNIEFHKFKKLYKMFILKSIDNHTKVEKNREIGNYYKILFKVNNPEKFKNDCIYHFERELNKDAFALIICPKEEKPIVLFENSGLIFIMNSDGSIYKRIT